MHLYDNVTVTLTRHGRKILDNYMEKLEKETGMEFKSPYINQSDDITIQLWSLIHIFGSDMYNMYIGGEKSFKDNEIIRGRSYKYTNGKTKDVYPDDKNLDKKFFGRFTEKERSEMSFHNPVIVVRDKFGDEEEIELSPRYMNYILNSTGKMDDMIIYCDAIYEGIKKMILVKENPSRNDIKNWYGLAKEIAVNM